MSELTKIAASQTPYNRRSRLDPHLADLRRLQSEGFSLAQLKEFLKEIGVTVSRQSIYDFLKRRESVTTVVEKNNQKQQDKRPATPDLTDEKKISTSLPKTGFHQVVEEIETKNKNTDPRRDN